jgi:hypothetical protein
LDKAFIAAPENFSGSMQVTAKLYSSDNLLTETKTIRFEWTRSQTEIRPGSVDATRALPVETSNGSGLIADHGTVTPGTSPPLSAADWLAQISSVPLPPDYRPVVQKRPSQPSTSPTPSTPSALLASGERFLREGNMAAARPLLRRAADAGRADAAVDLGMSFDPSLVPYGRPDGADPVEAARWYQRAFKLGRKDVAADLERVNNMARTTPP